ncbi:MAG TPA: LysR substrate-binding domain-containing protein [Ramlibacter sp.]|nr:LysR substrate-binding domain-containing protein [Ramlibacter sp.]
METRRLQYFVDIVDAGSISKAASLAGVAQAALSQQLGILENEFRCRLLVRTRTGVQLTSAGQVLYREAQDVLRRTSELKDLVRREATEISGVVSLGFTTGNVNLLAIDLLRQVRQLYPRVLLRVLEGMSGDLAEGVVNGQLDFATLAHEETRAGVESRAMLSEPLFVVASPSLCLASEITIAELARLPLLMPTSWQTLRGRYDALFNQAGVQAHYVAETDSVHFMKTAVLAGAGVAILPGSAWGEEHADGRVTLTAISGNSLMHHVWLAKRRPPHSDAVAAVEVLLVRAFARVAVSRKDA